jgi:hypothetical protein
MRKRQSIVQMGNFVDATSPESRIRFANIRKDRFAPAEVDDVG